MEKGRKFETIVGFFVLIVTTFFFNYVYTKSGWKKDDGYVLTATFDKADGLSEGVDVKISGVRVGKILSTSVDPETFMAIVKFYVSNNMKLPKDTCAAIQSEGLLGSKYLALLPGCDDENLKDGDIIYHTSGAINIESLIGQFMFSKNDNNSENKIDTQKSDQIEIFPIDNTDSSKTEQNIENDNYTNTDENTSISTTVQEIETPVSNGLSNINEQITEEDAEFAKNSSL